MGWGGYGIYDGDGTQSCHYNYLKWAGVSKSDDEISDYFTLAKTRIPKDKLDIFVKGLPKVIAKMPKYKQYWNETLAIEWQMLLALCVDNKIVPPHIIIFNGISATTYLLGDHAADFCESSKRRQCLRRFIKRVNKLVDAENCKNIANGKCNHPEYNRAIEDVLEILKTPWMGLDMSPNSCDEHYICAVKALCK